MRRPPVAKLRILSGNQKGVVLELTAYRIGIGRDEDNLIELSDEPVSRHHAELLRDGQEYRLRDLGSTNGTRVNNRRITDAILRDGDQIQFGTITLAYETVARSLTEATDIKRPAPPSTLPPVSSSSASAPVRSMPYVPKPVLPIKLPPVKPVGESAPPSEKVGEPQTAKRSNLATWFESLRKAAPNRDAEPPLVVPPRPRKEAIPSAPKLEELPAVVDTRDQTVPISLRSIPAVSEPAPATVEKPATAPEQTDLKPFDQPAAKVETEAGPVGAFRPPFLQKLEELDLQPDFLADLALKAVAQEAGSTTASIAARLCVGLLVADELLQRLYRDNLIEIKGVISPRNNRVAMLDRGWTAVGRLLSVCRYAGAAPVSLAAYTEMVAKQIRDRPPIDPQDLEKAMAALVLSDAAKQTLGLVAGSGRSLFVSGPSGNGKTAMACALVNAIAGHVWVPYAVEVDGQIIKVFDSHNHQTVEPGTEEYDHRWVKIRPPLIVVGGELTLQNLDLSNTNSHGFYEAPVQMKANGGVLVVDDLGRQRCSPTELLNRWIIPLEHRFDYMTLNTGKKISIPFEQIVVFATNLTSADLADEAFLRRMGYRINVVPPSRATYGEIFKRYARLRELTFEPAVLERLWQRYEKEHRRPKACDPRDLIERAIELCTYRRDAVSLSTELLDLAWDRYFGLSVEAGAPPTPPTS